MAVLRGLLGRLLPARPSSGDRQRATVPDPGRARDYRGPARIGYTPHPDGSADPGKVVWTWVPYEDDPARGKDRPVVVARIEPTGRSSSRSASLRSRQWLLLARGGWDAESRASSGRLDPVLRVAPAAVRREGATLDRQRFDVLAAELRRRHGWS